MSNRIRIFFFLLSIALLLPTVAFAQGGPPLVTDDPGTPGSGHWEDNFAFTLDNLNSEHLYETPIADINYGLGPSVQLKTEIGWILVKDPNRNVVYGLSNANLGVKIRFLDEEPSGLNLSTYPQYRLNYSRISTILFGNQFFLPLEASTSFGKLDLDGECGFDFIEDQPGQWDYGICAGYTISEDFEPLGELHGTTEPGQGTELLFNLGFRSKLWHNIYLIASGGRSFTFIAEYLGYLGAQVEIE